MMYLGGWDFFKPICVNCKSDIYFYELLFSIYIFQLSLHFHFYRYASEKHFFVLNFLTRCAQCRIHFFSTRTFPLLNGYYSQCPNLIWLLETYDFFSYPHFDLILGMCLIVFSKYAFHHEHYMCLN
jgi:hypothetical protein